MAIATSEILIRQMARYYDRLITSVMLPRVMAFHFPFPGACTSDEMWGAGKLPWGIWNGAEYDDGGGATIAAIRFQRCT